jgi:hypothetical protein
LNIEEYYIEMPSHYEKAFFITKRLVEWPPQLIEVLNKWVYSLLSV